MPSFGRSATSGNNNWNQNQGSNNQIASLFTIPQTGLITRLNVYVSGNGGTITGRLVIWDYPSGAVLAQTGDITFPSGATGINAQGWASGNLLTPYLATSGKAMYIGFWRTPSQTANYSWISGSGVIRPQVNVSHANVSSVSALSVSDGTTGQIGAYAEYVVGGLGYASGGTVKKYALKYALAGVFKRHPVKRYSTSASAWQWFA